MTAPTAPSTKYVVHAGDSPRIYVGQPTADRSGFRDKEDATDMTLYAVAQYVREHFAGAARITFDNAGIVLELRVEPLAAPAAGDAESAAAAR